MFEGACLTSIDSSVLRWRAEGLLASTVLAVLVGLLGLHLDRARRGSALARLLAGIAAALCALAFTHASTTPFTARPQAFTTGLENASRCFACDDGVTQLPSPMGVDETYFVRTRYRLGETRAFVVGNRVMKLTARPEGNVQLRIDREGPATFLSASNAHSFALHRIGDRWLMVGSAGPRTWRRVVAGPGAGRVVDVSEVFPRRVSASEISRWGLALAAPLALLLVLRSERERRRLRTLEVAMSGDTPAATGDAPSRSILGADGTEWLVSAPLPSATRTAFVFPNTSAPAYRDDPRPTVRLLHASPFDREATLASVRARIARFDALCVLVVLLLTAPAVGAHLRGLTVSLPFAIGSTP